MSYVTFFRASIRSERAALNPMPSETRTCIERATDVRLHRVSLAQRFSPSPSAVMHPLTREIDLEPRRPTSASRGAVRVAWGYARAHVLSAAVSYRTESRGHGDTPAGRHDAVPRRRAADSRRIGR